MQEPTVSAAPSRTPHQEHVQQTSQVGLWIEILIVMGLFGGSDEIVHTQVLHRKYYFKMMIL